MVLLIPDAVRQLIEKGRKAQRKRTREAFERFGFEVDGKLVLPRTPEVDAFLAGEEPTKE